MSEKKKVDETPFGTIFSVRLDDGTEKRIYRVVKNEHHYMKKKNGFGVSSWLFDQYDFDTIYIIYDGSTVKEHYWIDVDEFLFLAGEPEQYGGSDLQYFVPASEFNKV